VRRSKGIGSRIVRKVGLRGEPRGKNNLLGTKCRLSLPGGGGHYPSAVGVGLQTLDLRAKACPTIYPKRLRVIGEVPVHSCTRDVLVRFYPVDFRGHWEVWILVGIQHIIRVQFGIQSIGAPRATNRILGFEDEHIRQRMELHVRLRRNQPVPPCRISHVNLDPSFRELTYLILQLSDHIVEP
jgi:hypothetical protein